MTDKYKDLPPELIAQLKDTKSTVEPDILKCLQEHETANINEVLIYLFRTTGEVRNRGSISSVLAKMATDEKIKRVGKGKFSLKKAP